MDLFQQHIFEKTGKLPGLDLDTNLYRTLRLKEGDVNAANAALRIRRIDDVLSHLLAAQQLREEGGASNLEQAKRIERLCQNHPRFGMSAKRMLAGNVLRSKGDPR